MTALNNERCSEWLVELSLGDSSRNEGSPDPNGVDSGWKAESICLSYCRAHLFMRAIFRFIDKKIDRFT